MSSVSHRVLAAIVGIYAPTTSNTERPLLIKQIEEFERSANPQDVFTTATEILQQSHAYPAVQAYGAVMLGNMVQAGKIAPTSIPFRGLVNWLCTTPDLPRVVQHSTVNLVVRVALLVWPQSWPTMFDDVCPPEAATGASFPPALQYLLLSFLQAVLDPLVSLKKTSEVRAMVSGVGPATVSRVQNFTFHQYQILSAPVDASSSAPSSDATRAAATSQVDTCTSIICALCSLLPPASWVEMGVDTMLLTLLNVRSVFREVTCSAAVLLSDDRLTAAEVPLVNFAATIFRKVEPFIQCEDWDMVQELLSLALILKRDMLSALEDTLVTFCTLVLALPSVAFGITAFEILHKLFLLNDDSALPRISLLLDSQPHLLLRIIHNLILKNETHPVNGGQSRGAIFSQVHYPNVMEFNTAFAMLRNQANGILKCVSKRNPAACVQMSFELLAALPLEGDPSGRVTQRSVSFTQWEACQFILEAVGSDSFSRPNPLLTQCLNELFARGLEVSVKEPVLVPIFLNIISAFWICNDAEISVHLWRQTIATIFLVLRTWRGDTANEDMCAARKRALTILISASTHHPKSIIAAVPTIDDDFRTLIAAVRHQGEKGFLLESFASLSNEAAPLVQEKIIYDITEGSKSAIVLMTRSMTCVEDVVAMVIGANVVAAAGASPGFSGQGTLPAPTNPALLYRALSPPPASGAPRQSLRDAVSVITSVLRRCSVSSVAKVLAEEMCPWIVALICRIHALTPSMFPAKYAEVMSIDRADRDQLLGNTSKQPNSTNVRDESGRAQHFLYLLRMSLYQCFGALGKFLSLDGIYSGLDQIVAQATSVPVHVFKMLFDHALSPVCRAHPWSLQRVAPATVNVIVAVANHCNSSASASTSSASDDVVTSKTLFFLAKEFIAIMKFCVVIPQLHLQDPNALQLVCQSLFPLIEVCVDAKSIVFELVQIVSQLPEGGPARRDILKRMLVSVLAGPLLQRAPRDFETAAFSLADMCLTNACTAEVLIELGMSAVDTALLQEALAATTRGDVRKRKMVDGLKLLQRMMQGV